MLVPKIKFVFDRHHRAKRHPDGCGIIELRIGYGKDYKYITTGIQVQPERWDERNQVVVGVMDAKSYNLILSRMRTRALEVIAEMDNDGSFDLNAIPQMMKAHEEDMTFLDFIEFRINKEIGVKSENTIKNYVVFHGKMKEWGQMCYFKDVTFANIKKMNEWLKKRSLQDETIYGYNKFLRKFINDAVSEGRLKENPYSARQIKLKHGTPNAENYITEEELQSLMDAELPTESLRRVRDMFVFQCLTGLAYGDLQAFDAKKIKEVDGYKVYSGRRGKTGVKFFVVLLDEALAIIESYKGKLPVMTNQQYNMRLKIVAEAAGLEKPLTTHWARHTAATIWINRGVPIEVISKMLGHSSTRITEKVYSMLQEKTIVGAVAKMKKLT